MDKRASEVVRRDDDAYWGHNVNKRDDDAYWGHNVNKRGELLENCAQSAKGTVFCSWTSDEVTAHGDTESALKTNCFEHSEGGIVCAYHMVRILPGDR